MKSNINFWYYVAKFFLEWEVFQIEFLKNLKTNFMFNSIFSENRSVYEIMWKNIVGRGRPQMTT